MIDKLIPNSTFRSWVKTIMFPTTYSQYTILSLLRLIKTDDRFRAQKTILLTISVSLVHYLLFPIFILYKTYAERVVIRNLIRSKKKIKGTVNTVCVYAPWFDKFAGGSEAVSACIAQYFEEKYPFAKITILCDDYFGNIIAKPATLDEINDKYGTDLKRTTLIFKKHGYYSFFMYRYYINMLKTSTNYDVFINSFMDITPTNASVNMHYIHFPGSKTEALSNYLFSLYQGSIDSFIANSKYTAYWTKRQLATEKVTVIEPPVMLENKYLPPQKQKIVITAGRISVEKNLELLIKIFIDFKHFWPDWEYHIVGSKNPNNLDYYQKLEKLAAGHPVKFYTNLPKKEFNSRLADATIYWHGMGYGVDLNSFPGQTEHFGMTVVEAMSFGCVPLVFDIGGPVDIVADNNCGFTWANPTELVQHTKHLISDPTLLSSMSKQSFISAEDYSLAHFMDKFDIEIKKTLEQVNQIDKI